MSVIKTCPLFRVVTEGKLRSHPSAGLLVISKCRDCESVAVKLLVKYPHEVPILVGVNSVTVREENKVKMGAAIGCQI
jgi:hypothetical protein